MKKYIKETIIKQVVIDELDFDIEKELLGDNSVDNDYEFLRDNTHNVKWNNEGPYISAQSLSNIINDLIDKGSTHIQIEPQYDHYGYIISGTKLETISEKSAAKYKIDDINNEIKIRENELKRDYSSIEQKQKEIDKLYEELKQLKNNKKNE
jgi:uncharacterized protein YaaN involved in tellurite resistance